MTEQPDMKLELVPIPVSDIDRAKAFYVDMVGFHLDYETPLGNGMHMIQLTPPGSGCSILLSKGLGEISEMKPGSVKGIHLVVKNISATSDLLISRGVEVGAIREYPRGIKDAGFSDPDGNLWILQEIPSNL